MYRISAWISSHGLTVIVGAAMFVLGVALSVPLGWKLPDTIASLFGSIAGAVGAIGGAFFLWREQENRENAIIRKHITNQARTVMFQIESVRCDVKNTQITDVRTQVFESKKVVAQVSKRLARLEMHFYKLDGYQLEEFGILEDQIENARGLFESISALSGLNLFESRENVDLLLAQNRDGIQEMLIELAPTAAEADDFRALSQMWIENG